MLLRPHGYIIIDDQYKIPYTQEVEINTSRNMITDTAKFTFPNKINYTGGKITDQLKVGYSVVIVLGYFPDMQIEFTGYISAIIPDLTATVECEDEAFIYKRKTIEKSFTLKNTTIENLINKIYSGKSKIFDAKVGDWQVQKGATVVDVLHELKKKFSIFSYWRGDTLIVGGTLGENDGKEVGVIVDFQGNVPEGESNLDVKNATSSGRVVMGRTLKRNGELILVYASYNRKYEIKYSKTPPDGSIVSEIKIGKNNKITEEEIKRLCAIKLNALSNTGINGNVTIYGQPSATHGGNAVLKDKRRSKDIDGTYKIVGIKKIMSSTKGYRQQIDLGLKII